MLSIFKGTLYKFLSQIIEITMRYCKYTIDQHIQIQLQIILGVVYSNPTFMLIIELMMYTSCVQGNAYCHCTLFHALILIVKLLLWKEIMLNNVAVVWLLRVCCNIWKAKSTELICLRVNYIYSFRAYK